MIRTHFCMSGWSEFRITGVRITGTLLYTHNVSTVLRVVPRASLNIFFTTYVWTNSYPSALSQLIYHLQNIASLSVQLCLLHKNYFKYDRFIPPKSCLHHESISTSQWAKWGFSNTCPTIRINEAAAKRMPILVSVFSRVYLLDSFSAAAVLERHGRTSPVCNRRTRFKKKKGKKPKPVPVLKSVYSMQRIEFPIQASTPTCIVGRVEHSELTFGH